MDASCDFYFTSIWRYGNGVGFNVGMHVRNSRRKNGNQERRNEHTDEGGGKAEKMDKKIVQFIGQ